MLKTGEKKTASTKTCLFAGVGRLPERGGGKREGGTQSVEEERKNKKREKELHQKKKSIGLVEGGKGRKESAPLPGGRKKRS